jgi:deazaflavin-dependent oxidoreductase (nitroreductase family)
MNPLDDPVDPPSGWQADHIRQYVSSNGEEGHIWNGVPTLLLTTKGRKSGKGRRTPLIYGRDGDRYVVVASKGGTPEHPLWYDNLVADPHVRLQVGPEVFDATASTADDETRNRLWPRMAEIWPDYDNYQTKTSRQIPIVVLERADSQG